MGVSASQNFNKGFAFSYWPKHLRKKFSKKCFMKNTTHTKKNEVIYKNCQDTCSPVPVNPSILESIVNLSLQVVNSCLIHCQKDSKVNSNWDAGI